MKKKRIKFKSKNTTRKPRQTQAHSHKVHYMISSHDTRSPLGDSRCVGNTLRTKPTIVRKFSK